jgi:hypothetical protein
MGKDRSFRLLSAEHGLGLALEIDVRVAAVAACAQALTCE